MDTKSPVSSNNSVSGQAESAAVAVSFVFMVVYMAAVSAFGSFVNDMYLPSLPEMRTFFGCSVSMVQMGLAVGMAGLAIGQLVLGPVSDRRGRKPVLVWTLILFIVAAIVSIFSPTIHFFLACRFFQGLGASACYFLARTIPTDVYTGRTLARTMAIIGAINGFAPAFAPVLGGFVSDRWGWRGVFICLAVFALILVCVSPRLKETLVPAKRSKGSFADTYRSYGVLLKNRRFMLHSLFKGSALGLLFAYISSAPFIMQTHFGWSEIRFGLFMGFNALFTAGGSMTALRFKVLKKAGMVGALLIMAAVAAQAFILYFADSFWAYEALLLPMMFGMGMIFTVGNTLAMNEGRADAGGASAIVGIIGYIFGAIVTPLVGLGDIMHSTAWVFLAMAALTLLLGAACSRLAPDLD